MIFLIHVKIQKGFFADDNTAIVYFKSKNVTNDVELDIKSMFCCQQNDSQRI